MTIPPVITNFSYRSGSTKPDSNEFCLFHLINEHLRRTTPKSFDVLTGYFSSNVWRLVGDAVALLPAADDGRSSFRMVIGREISKFDAVELQRRFAEELADAEFELAPHIRKLILFLRRSDVSVRLLSKPFMHGKLYLFPDLAVVGSSNLTISGLYKNHELNLTTEITSVLRELEKWFEYYWRKADDYKDIMLGILNKSWLGLYPWTPFDVYTKTAFEYYRPSLSGDLSQTVVSLASFQREGVIKALKAIDKRGGVLIADAVGLGKSFTGLEVSLQALKKVDDVPFPRFLIICPAQLRPMWKPILEGYDLPYTLISMEKLSKEIPTGKFSVVLIDECHNFRRPTTKRYQNLQRLLGRNLSCKVILLSATPINTNIMDIYHQIRLITRNVDSNLSLTRIGITDLYTYFKALTDDIGDFQQIKDAYLVCRSRSEIRFRQEMLNIDLALPDGKLIRFPHRQLNTVKYTISNPASKSGMTSGQFYSRIDALLSQLKFPQFTWQEFRLPECGLDKRAAILGKTISAMIHALFLKRLESSLHSFLASISGQMSLLKIFLEAFLHGYALSTPIMRTLLDRDDNSLENEELDDSICIDLLLADPKTKEMLKGKFEKKGNGRVNPNEYRLDDLERMIEEDLKIWKELKAYVLKLFETEDRKLKTLVELLNRIRKENERLKPFDPPTKVLLFSYFRGTIDYLHDRLTKPDSEYFVPNCVIEKITGKTSTKDRNEKIFAFAPFSNPNTKTEEFTEKEKNTEKNGSVIEPIDVLICTDVLSEGQNLQDANHIVNYDLHWNPVRMIQRAGRIDRLKSPHGVITVHNFFVEDGLEELLGLMNRIATRLDDIDQTIELDGAVLRPRATSKRDADLIRIQRGDMTVWEEYESKIELSDHNPTTKTLQQEIKKLGAALLQKRPLGIHSGRVVQGEGGMVVALQINYLEGGTETRWVFDPDRPERFEGMLKGGLITNRREVENLLRCKPDEPRVLIETEDLFLRVKRIRDKVTRYIDEEALVKGGASKFVKGSKKYAKHIVECVRNHSLDSNYCRPFLDYAQNHSLTAVASDISETLDRFNKALDKLKGLKRKAGHDRRLLKEITKEKSVIVKEFLEGIYEYFKIHNIRPGEEKKSTRQRPRLVGFMRLINAEALTKSN